MSVGIDPKDRRSLARWSVAGGVMGVGCLAWPSLLLVLLLRQTPAELGFTNTRDLAVLTWTCAASVVVSFAIGVVVLRARRLLREDAEYKRKMRAFE